MSSQQVIITTAFGATAENLDTTFASFAKVRDAELHAFVYGDALPRNQHPAIRYHLAKFEPRFVSVRRDALFRRWTWPDRLDAAYVLVVDAFDAICVRPLPPFAALLRGASLAAATEWIRPVRIPGQGYTSCYLNAGVTFWDVAKSKEIRQEIADRGRATYRGPFDDQTALNEVMHTRYFDQLTILPSQFNWRAYYRRSYWSWRSHFRFWPRVDFLDGVYIYHNHHCFERVARDIQQNPPAKQARLPTLPHDRHPLSGRTLFWRRLVHRWLYS